MSTQTKTEFILISRQTGDEIMCETNLEDALTAVSFAGRDGVRVVERIIRTEIEEREIKL